MTGKAVAEDAYGIKSRILAIRGQKVILDRDLAALYGVPTSRFNEAVKRNRRRFPEDFAFQLTRQELTDLISQTAISSSGHGGIRKLPWALQSMSGKRERSHLPEAQARLPQILGPLPSGTQLRCVRVAGVRP